MAIGAELRAGFGEVPDATLAGGVRLGDRAAFAEWFEPADAVDQPLADAPTEEASLKEVGAKRQPLIFFLVLQADGHDPQYFGETVQPGDAGAVLVEWTLDDGRTRAIYGDLEAATLP
jgi:hypothetical protein